MGITIMELLEDTLSNCKYYEKENKIQHLLNEIGVLRGLAYALEIIGVCPHTDEIQHFMGVAHEILRKADEN